MDNNLSCNICLSNYDTNKHLPTILMFCGHSFCSKCVNEIKKQSNLCPTCRKMIVKRKTNHALVYALGVLETSQKTNGLLH